MTHRRYNRISDVLVTAPATTPVSLAQVKSNMGITISDDDTFITGLIEAATEMAQKFTRRSFITQTRRKTMDDFAPMGERNDCELSGGESMGYSPAFRGGSADIELPYGPIQSVTSITTYDEDNNSSVYSSANYFVDTDGERVVLNRGNTWPTDLRDRAGIQVLYVAGYGDNATDVPQAIRTAISLHVERMYEDRCICELGESCKGLLQAYRRFDNIGMML